MKRGPKKKPYNEYATEQERANLKIQRIRAHKIEIEILGFTIDEREEMIKMYKEYLANKLKQQENE